MKKVAMFALIAAIATPALAETPKNDAVPDVSEELVMPAPKTEYKNSQTKFPRGMQAGIGISGTSGLNGFVGYANKKFDSFWWKRIGGRLDFATLSPFKSMINSSIDSAMDGAFEFGDGVELDNFAVSGHHMGALVDIYPFGDTWFAGGWRLTGGYVFGKLGADADVKGKVSSLPGGGFEFELDGIQYMYSGNTFAGNSNVDWKYSGPYLGTGFDLGLFYGIKIYMDLGAVFTSKTAQVGLDVPLDGLKVSHDGGATWVNVGGAWDAELDAAKAAVLKEANDELGKIKIFPMVKLGLMYRF